MNEAKTYYHRNLPHYNPSCATFFITFRLNGSLPQEVVKRLQEQYKQDLHVLKNSADEKELQKEKLSLLQRRYFGRFDDLLDGSSSGPQWLKEEKVALIVLEALQYRNGKEYNLIAAIVMPNHIHVVLQVERNDISLYRILQSLKRRTASEGNKVLCRSGAFWQHESYDHVVRSEKELERIILYVVNNPVKAGFTKHPQEWRWLYLHHDLTYLLE